MSGKTRTGPGKPPKTEGPSTKDRILDAAIDLFTQIGFNGTRSRWDLRCRSYEV